MHPHTQGPYHGRHSGAVTERTLVEPEQTRCAGSATTDRGFESEESCETPSQADPGGRAVHHVLSELDQHSTVHTCTHEKPTVKQGALTKMMVHTRFLSLHWVCTGGLTAQWAPQMLDYWTSFCPQRAMNDRGKG